MCVCVYIYMSVCVCMHACVIQTYVHLNGRPLHGGVQTEGEVVNANDTQHNRHHHQTQI